MLVFRRESIAKRWSCCSIFWKLRLGYFFCSFCESDKYLCFFVKGKLIWGFHKKVKEMPNLMNRRKKKNKVVDIVVNENSDSDSSCSYDFSSKLNCKYNVLPADLNPSKSAQANDDKEDCKSIRFESNSTPRTSSKGLHNLINMLRKNCLMKM